MSENQTPTQPTKEEFIAHLSDQIEIAEIRAKLQTLNTTIATERAKELEALVFIAQLTNPQPAQGPEEEEEQTEQASEKPSKERKLKTV